MQRRTTIPLCIGMTSLAVLALAGTAHFEMQPVISNDGAALTVTGMLSGIETRDVIVRVHGSGMAMANCVDPVGNHPSSHVGDRKAVEATGAQSIPASHVIDGRVPFTVSTDVPKFRSPKAAGCPNKHWNVEAKDVVFNSVTISVWQADRIVLKQTLKP
jgi:hypothetical protein